MSSTSSAVVGRKYWVPFVLLTFCFALWGLANNMTDPLVKVFSRVFVMSNLQASLVQFSFYGAYFCLALPAALLIKRFSYKTGVLTGLGMFAVGALLFFPASRSMEFAHFLTAIFVLAAGLSILETSCNPYIIAMGDEATSTRRLNLAQSFNPVGSVMGTMLAGFLILPNINIADDADRLAMDAAELAAVQSAELAAVMGPYVGTALVLVVLWIAIAFTPMPALSAPGLSIELLPTLRRLASNRHYTFGVGAQFFYVAAQICVWTFTIHYISDIIAAGKGAPLVGFLSESGISAALEALHLVPHSENLGPEAVAGIYHISALIIFLAFRFICTALMHRIRATVMLAFMAGLACAFCLAVILFPGLGGVLCIVGISACMSLMFPTIYGIALKGLGDDTKIGGAGLVMAILGGALLPLLQATIIDHANAALSYVVPLFCFLVVGAYAGFDLRSRRA